jgi:hypothetical protein
MKRVEFNKDKYSKIRKGARQLLATVPEHGGERISDADMKLLKDTILAIIQQVFELNAGRNILLDNDKDQR